MRVYALDSNFPQFAYQNANDGSGWSGWLKPIGGSWGTYQPTAANINGEIELLTDWCTAGMEEALLP